MVTGRLSLYLILRSIIFGKLDKITLFNGSAIIQNKLYIAIVKKLKIPLDIRLIHVSDQAVRHKSIIELLQNNAGGFNSKIVDIVTNITGMSKQHAILFIKKHYRPYLLVQSFLSDMPDKDAVFIEHDDFNLPQKSKNLYLLPDLLIGIWQRLLIFLLGTQLVISLLRRSRFYLGPIEKAEEDMVMHTTDIGCGDKVGISESIALSIGGVSLLLHPSRNFSEDELISHRQRCKANGINFYEYKQFFWNFSFLLSSIRFLFFTIFYITKIRLYEIELSIVLRTLKHTFDEMILLNNLACKKFVADDDFSPAHFIRTQLLHKQGSKHIGIQHSSGNGIYGGGSIIYVHFDTYLVWNPFSLYNFKQYWNNINVKELGYRRIDNSIKKYEEITQVHKIKEAVNRKFFIGSDNVINILITLPRYTSDKQFNETFKNAKSFLSILKDIVPKYINTLNFIIRPKIDTMPKGVFDDLKEMLNSPNLVVCDIDDFQTSDLIVWSDLVIASNGSGVITESCLLGRKVVTFDFIGVICDLWSMFGSDMCIHDHLHFSRIINSVANNEALKVDYTMLNEMMVSKSNKVPLAGLVS